MKSYISKTAELFAELLEKGSISASSISRGSHETKAQFKRLSAAGIINKQRSGGGNRYQLLHPNSFQAFADSQFPSGLVKPSENYSNRTFGVLTRADSKTTAKLGFDLVTLRGNSELCVNHTKYQLNNSDDVFLSLKISDASLITIAKAKCRIVTIENPTVFAELNKITDLKWDIAVYTAGKMSSLLINQLQQWYEAGHQLVHFGDYDYVGLLEYARILDLCPEAELHVPNYLDKKFIARFGNSELHEKQITQHETLLTKLEILPESDQKQSLIEIYKLLQSTAKGLEQEAFLKAKI